jgi:hypothetical protein
MTANQSNIRLALYVITARAYIDKSPAEITNKPTP